MHAHMCANLHMYTQPHSKDGGHGLHTKWTAWRAWPGSFPSSWSGLKSCSRTRSYLYIMWILQLWTPGLPSSYPWIPVCPVAGTRDTWIPEAAAPLQLLYGPLPVTHIQTQTILSRSCFRPTVSPAADTRACSSSGSGSVLWSLQYLTCRALVSTSLSWFNPSQQPSTTQPLPHCPPLPPVRWGGESGKKVELMGWDKNSLITKVKYNVNNSNNEI